MAFLMTIFLTFQHCQKLFWNNTFVVIDGQKKAKLGDGADVVSDAVGLYILYYISRVPRTGSSPRLMRRLRS